jgi:hypothetical protein
LRTYAQDGGAGAGARSERVHEFLGESFWRGKPIAFVGEGAASGEAAHLPAGAEGIFEGALDMNAFAEFMKQRRCART